MRPLPLLLTGALLACAAFVAYSSMVITDPPPPPRVVTGIEETNLTAFRPGQVWAYQTRPGEDSSTVTILRVEEAPKLGVIVHVAVEGVRVPSPTPGQFVTRLVHLPFAKAAIERSVTRKLRDDAPVPSFDEGYQQWRAAFDTGSGGIFTITIAEAVDVVSQVH